MYTVKARVIAEPDTRQRIVLSLPTVPAVNGNGNLNVVCGGCGAVLIQHAPQCLPLRNVVIRCPSCRRCNCTG